MITGILLMCMNFTCFDRNLDMYVEMTYWYENSRTNFVEQDYVSLGFDIVHKRYWMTEDTKQEIMCFTQWEVPSALLNSPLWAKEKVNKEFLFQNK